MIKVRTHGVVVFDNEACLLKFPSKKIITYWISINQIPHPDLAMHRVRPITIYTLDISQTTISRYWTWWQRGKNASNSPKNTQTSPSGNICSVFWEYFENNDPKVHFDNLINSGISRARTGEINIEVTVVNIVLMYKLTNMECLQSIMTTHSNLTW